MSRLHVHLYRDSFNTPWGFRLQGGKDLHQPLVVQRVFSNSPAEGELQRGDVIESINSRDTSQLTHKQAQDLIKHGGGQVQLVVKRPPPGTHVAPLSPPIVTQQPRAPSLYDRRSHHPPHSPSRPSNMSMYQYADHRPPQYGVSVSVTPQYNRQRSTSSQPPTTPTTPIPPWASQQPAPKRVSKLSRLGGGTSGYSFCTDFATMPRSRSSMAHHGVRSTPREADFQDGADESVEPDHLATGPIPKVCNLRNLGGGGISFGSEYGTSTLPRRNQPRRQSQPPSMPGAGGYGHMPTKLTLNRLGGGGPQFGSDYSGYRAAPDYGGYRGSGQTPAQRYEPRTDRSVMLNRVQTSLDSITLSPRSPEAPQGSPFYQQYEPAAPPPPQQMYTPTGLLLEQQRLQEQQQQQQDEGEEQIVPVWERRKQFLQQPDAGVRTPLHKAPPRIPRPKPGQSSYGDFGTDYSKPQGPRQSNAQWKPAQPAPQFNPAPAPVHVPVVQYSPGRPGAPDPRPVKIDNVDRAAAPEWHPPQYSGEDGVPAWRSSLRSSTGVKPWERDMSYSQDQEAVRSVPYSPSAPTSGPYGAPPAVATAPQGGGGEDGPKVVHLQYNSPMGLYSNQNVAETLHGQTQAMSGNAKPNQPRGGQSGDRDWSQSSVLRFIEQQDRREAKMAPATAPKPQHYHQGPQQTQPQVYYDEVGASDF